MADALLVSVDVVHDGLGVLAGEDAQAHVSHTQVGRHAHAAHAHQGAARFGGLAAEDLAQLFLHKAADFLLSCSIHFVDCYSFCGCKGSASRAQNEQVYLFLCRDAAYLRQFIGKGTTFSRISGYSRTSRAQNKKPGMTIHPRFLSHAPAVALFSLDYSSGSMTTSTLLPALMSWRAKAAMLSGVWAFTMSMMPVWPS